MNTKLTLTLDSNIINKAKNYAAKRQVSLSKLVEFYFSSLASASSKQKLKDVLPPITSELSGLLDNDTKANYKEIISDALSEKYL